MKKKRTRIYLYDREKKQGIELRCDKGVWYKIVSENEGRRELSTTDVYRLIFTIGAYADDRKRRKYRNAVFKYSQAIEYLRRGYTLLDTHLNRYILDPERGITRNNESFPVLPYFEKYILDIFKERSIIKAEKKPRHRVKKDYIPEKMKASHPFDTDTLREIKRNIEIKKTQRKPETPSESAWWEWIIPIAAGSIGIAALSCLIGKSNNNQNRMYNEY